MKKFIVTLGLLLATTVPAFANQAVNSTSVNANSNENANQSGAVSTGGDSENRNAVILDDRDYHQSESKNNVFYQIPGLHLQDIDQMIKTRIGVVNCAVEESGGSEIRLGFPPSIVIKDQSVDGGDCLNALNSMAAFVQADAMTYIINYVKEMDSYNQSQKDLMIKTLEQKIADLFIENMEELTNEGRATEINKLKQIPVGSERVRPSYDEILKGK